MAQQLWGLQSVQQWLVQPCLGPLWWGWHLELEGWWLGLLWWESQLTEQLWVQLWLGWLSVLPWLEKPMGLQ